MEKLPLVVLLLETILFAVLERNLWRTWVSPLNCLMLPYTSVVLVCVLVEGNMGFVPFYYPSLWVWVLGLLAFFIPSFTLSLLFKAGTSPSKDTFAVHSSWMIPSLEIITQLICALYLVRMLYLIFVLRLVPGSESFAYQLAGGGLWGHMFTLFMVLAVVWIYLADRKNWRYFLYVVFFSMVGVLCMVKGWLLIPLLGGVLLRIFSGRLIIRIRYVLLAAILGFGIFFLSYWVAMVWVRGEEDAARYGMTRDEYIAASSSYIKRHFVTYLTAGVYGLSESMAQGTLEEKDPSMVYTSFYNIKNLFTGEEMVTGLNDNFVKTTVYDNGVNVRSFMGTLFLYLGAWQSVLYVLLFSLIINTLYFISRQTHHLLISAVVAWYMSTLCMGWFDSYVQTLNYITVPLFTVCVYAWVVYLRLRERNTCLPVQNPVRPLI